LSSETFAIFVLSSMMRAASRLAASGFAPSSRIGSRIGSRIAWDRASRGVVHRVGSCIARTRARSRISWDRASRGIAHRVGTSVRPGGAGLQVEPVARGERGSPGTSPHPWE